MEPITIKAVVKFNYGEAYILSRMPEFRYKRLGSSILYAEDSGFLNVYQYGSYPGRNNRAFAGREFDIPMEDGTSIRATGQWWDGGRGIVEKHLGYEMCHVTFQTEENLKESYIFTGASIEKEYMEKMRAEYTGCVYPYWEYEKILKYDDMRRGFYKREYRLEKKCNAILKEARMWKAMYLDKKKEHEK